MLDFVHPSAPGETSAAKTTTDSESEVAVDDGRVQRQQRSPGSSRARGVETLRLVRALAEQIDGSRPPAEIAGSAVDLLARRLHDSSLSVLLLEAHGSLRPLAVGGLCGDGSRLSELRFLEDCAPQLGHGLAGWVAREGEPVNTGDAEADPRYVELRRAGRSRPCRSEVCIPIRHGRVAVGVLRAVSQRRDAYSPIDVEVLAIAAASIANQLVAHECQALLHAARRDEVLGQVTGSVVHDLNNLVTILSVSLQDGHGRDGSGSTIEQRPLLQTACNSISALTSRLSAFARGGPIERKRIAVHDVIQTFAPVLETMVGKGARLVLTLDAFHHNVMADRSELEQILMNLTLNASRAMHGSGQLVIRTGDGHFSSRTSPWLLLSVSDSGGGMDDRTRRELRAPYLEARQARAGLGLVTVRRIVADLGGQIDFVSKEAGGTTVRMSLPTLGVGAPER